MLLAVLLGPQQLNFYRNRSPNRSRVAVASAACEPCEYEVPIGGSCQTAAKASASCIGMPRGA
jgi:hypothetical protein